MKRFLNVRIPLLLALALALGILLGYLFIYFDIDLFWITAVVPIAAVIIILFAVFSFKIAKIIITVLAAIMLMIGTFYGYFCLYSFDNSVITDGEYYTVSATVSEKGETEYGEYVILKNAYINGLKVNGHIIVYLSEQYGEFCDVGYKVRFTSKITKNSLFLNGKLNYYAQQNVKYRSNVYGGLTAKYGYSFFGIIRSHIRSTLYSSLDKDTAAVAFAMLTGNTQGIDEATITSFRYGGIAHIFAVSGLHVGILFGLLYFIFKKLKLKNLALLACCLIPVYFYVGICGFTLSSMRAAIMCSVSALSNLSHKKYDSLNSLCLAVIIILLINPLNLFSVGFQLAVSATGTIILLSKNICRPLRKLPRNLAGSISVSLSAQAGTLPVLFTNFGYVSGAGLLLNVLVLPLLSVAYVILFAGCAIAAIIPPTTVILPYVTIPLKIFISLFATTNFDGALINASDVRICIPVYFLGILVLSDKLNINKYVRLAAASFIFLFLVIYALF